MWLHRHARLLRKIATRVPLPPHPRPPQCVALWSLPEAGSGAAEAQYQEAAPKPGAAGLQRKFEVRSRAGAGLCSDAMGKRCSRHTSCGLLLTTQFAGCQVRMRFEAPCVPV